MKKTKVAPTAEVEDQTITGYEPQQSGRHDDTVSVEPATPRDETTIKGDEPGDTRRCKRSRTQPVAGADEEMQPGGNSQQSGFQCEYMQQDAQAAFDDMKKLFVHKRKSIAVGTCFSLLKPETRAYLRSQDPSGLNLEWL